MDRNQKEQLVGELRELFTTTNLLVVTHYSGLTVAEMTNLRRRVTEEDAKYQVTKNRLVRLALEGSGKEQIADLFTGPTGIAYSHDPVAAAKVVVRFAKDNECLVILGGILGDTMLDEQAIRALAELPSLDELRARLVGFLSTPAQRLATVLQAPAGQMARVLGAYADSQ